MRFFFGLIAMMSVAIAGSPSIAAKKQKAPPTPPAPQRLTPPPMTDKENLLYLDLSTGGRVVIWLRPDVAPKMVERVKTLTGHHPADPDQSFALQAAVTGARLLDWPATPTPAPGP